MFAISTRNRVGISAGVVSDGASVAVVVVVGSEPTVVVVSGSVDVLHAASVNAPATKNAAPLLVILMISPVSVTLRVSLTEERPRARVPIPDRAVFTGCSEV